jgi:hypothetical protein
MKQHNHKIFRKTSLHWWNLVGSHKVKTYSLVKVIELGKKYESCMSPGNQKHLDQNNRFGQHHDRNQ